MRAETHGPGDAGLRRRDPVPGVVSVIIPAVNASRWIAETIRSVHAQTYRPIEIIVVDDGSADDTALLAAGSGATVLHTHAAGPGGARNAGLAHARGAFIQFLDADDLLAPVKIARQVGALDSSGFDVAWEPFHHLVPSPNDAFELGRRVVPELGTDLAASLLTSRGFVQIGALMIRRTPRTDAVWFEPGREVVEDVRYMVALAMAGARFVSSDSPEPGLLYRQHTDPRYSTRPIVSFARGCVANAAWAEHRWSVSGGLTPERRAALSEAYAFAARQLAGVDAVAFEEASRRGRALGEEFLRHLPARVRWLSRVVGYPRAEAIARTWRRISGARTRHGSGTGGWRRGASGVEAR